VNIITVTIAIIIIVVIVTIVDVPACFIFRLTFKIILLRLLKLY